MKTLENLRLSLVLLIGTFVTSASAGPIPHGQGDYPNHVANKEAAMECCTPKAKLALTCETCKSLTTKKGTDKTGILSWFASDSKHDCSGCGGKITYRNTGGGKGPILVQYTHVCTKCGDNSAYVCSEHKK